MRSKSTAGFTLIELLVAITVLALLTTLLFGGLQFGTRVWRIGDEDLDRFQQMDATFGLLRRMLTAASPKLAGEADQQGRGERGEAVVDFDGLTDGVSFVGPPPAAVLGGGLYRLTFGVIDVDGEGRLLLAMQPLTAEAPAAPEAATMTLVLLDGIERARFAYYGVTRDAEEATWYDRWQDQSTLPQIVSVQIEFRSGDRRVWPQLLVAPQLSMPLQ